MGAEKIIPNAVKRNMALIKAKKSSGIATKADLELEQKYKTLYPSMF
tara:strand:- start:1497 stop:1637 length:141 start_codon:yes stop_codon:yes gene_type:complete